MGIKFERLPSTWWMTRRKRRRCRWRWKPSDDVVVNNAGYGDVAPFEQLSTERFKALMDTNFYGVVNVTRAALPIMRKQKSGCILQISSVGGRLALPGNAGYHAAKWAVGGFIESLAQEVATFGV